MFGLVQGVLRVAKRGNQARPHGLCSVAGVGIESHRVVYCHVVSIENPESCRSCSSSGSQCSIFYHCKTQKIPETGQDARERCSRILQTAIGTWLLTGAQLAGLSIVLLILQSHINWLVVLLSRFASRQVASEKLLSFIVFWSLHPVLYGHM